MPLSRKFHHDEDLKKPPKVKCPACGRKDHLIGEEHTVSNRSEPVVVGSCRGCHRDLVFFVRSNRAVLANPGQGPREGD